MAHVAFRQADIERIIRAARRESAIVQIDLKTYIVTIYPASTKNTLAPLSSYAPDGEEKWDD